MKLAVINSRPEKGNYKVIEIKGAWVTLQDIKNKYLPFSRLLKTVTITDNI